MPEQSSLWTPTPLPRLASVPLPAGVTASARWSADRRYRYSLTWRKGVSALPAVIGLNPSGASETCGDRTLVRVLGFLPMGFVMLNLFALRATKPAELGRSADPIGERADEVLIEEVARAPYVVAAWGAPPSGRVGALVRARTAVVRRALAGRDVRCWGVTRDGSPRHPLYLSGAAELTAWEGR